MKDYEKKYKEALEMAKKYKLKEDLIITQDIFPELKESEDEMIRRRIIHALHGDVLEMSEIKEAIAWLEKQGAQKSYVSETMNEKGDFDNGFTRMMEKEQKPAWSEEDEKIIDAIYSCVNSYYDGLAKDALLIWLKSLRPQNTWKPSDEQIKVCKEVYADLLSAKGFDVGTINSELNRLEEELRKLK